MDALKTTWEQANSLFGKMSPSQRLTLIAVPIVLMAAFAALTYRGSTSSRAALSWGKTFTTDELVSAEQTLIEAGLNDFSREGQRLMVPAHEVEKYNAALLVDGNLPSQWASEFEKQLEKSSIFTSSDQLQAMKDVALQKELRTVLRAVPDIDDAHVHWARSRAARWPDRRERVTATVTLRPRRGRELGGDTVRSIRAAVANMIPNLMPEDVTIFDQTTAKAYTAERAGDPFDAKVIGWIEQHTRIYQDKISKALSYIPEVLVTVNVDIDNIRTQIVREQTVDAKKTVTLASRDVSRSVTSSEQATEAEPGAVSNVPRQLSSSTAARRSMKTDESDSQSRTVPSFRVTEQEFLSAMPKAVQVSVSVPEEYYDGVALQRGLSSGEDGADKKAFDTAVATIRKEEEQKVRDQIRLLIPAGSPDTAVHVTSVTRVIPEVPEISIPWTQITGELVHDWGGTVVLSLLGFWIVYTITRGLPKIEQTEAFPDDPETTLAQKANIMPKEPDAPPEPTQRDLLQDTVRDNPDVAAAILGKWIQAAR
ncbi:hypothetical protein [Calycomorphotria hydatis]|uniref:Flagellar M-ring protein n=1 Tax=Calycomorphotria hydatis TaxID=2528027 RepID=A0A517TB98_9PLAN|nr:hypothetical protein [Calycomorphotria hydatis]QDT65651.1 Flagellar M-ring protein [Calycomorphotria hydatis]